MTYFLHCALAVAFMAVYGLLSRTTHGFFRAIRPLSAPLPDTEAPDTDTPDADAPAVVTLPEVQTPAPKFCAGDAMVGVLLLLLALGCGWQWSASVYGLLCQCALSTFLFITIVDVKYMEIPQKTMLVMAIFSIASAFVNPNTFFFDPVLTGLLMFLGALLVHKITRGEFGLGDVQMLGAMGFLCGFSHLSAAITLSLVSALIVGGIWALRKKKGTHAPIPFAPFLLLSTAVVLIFSIT